MQNVPECQGQGGGGGGMGVCVGSSLWGCLGPHTKQYAAMTAHSQSNTWICFDFLCKFSAAQINSKPSHFLGTQQGHERQWKNQDSRNGGFNLHSSNDCPRISVESEGL